MFNREKYETTCSTWNVFRASNTTHDEKYHELYKLKVKQKNKKNETTKTGLFVFRLFFTCECGVLQVVLRLRALTEED